MSAAEIKKELHGLIEKGDDSFIHMMWKTAKTYQGKNYTSSSTPMSEEELIKRIQLSKTQIEQGDFITQEDLEEEMKNW